MDVARRGQVRAVVLLAWITGAAACHGPRGATRAAADPAAPRSPASTLVGGGGPMVIDRADPLGRWIVYCEVLRDTDGDGQVWGGASNHGLVGDTFEPQLWHEGTTLPLQSLLGASADGRWLVVQTQGPATLIDVERGTQTPLPVAPPAHAYSFASRVEFAPGDSRMLYVRATTHGGEVVVRELEGGRERTLRAPSGTLWRAWFDDDGEHVWADYVDGGEAELPVADTNLVVGQCHSSAATSTWGAWSGAQPRRFTAPDGQHLLPAPGGLAYLDGALLEREVDGRLVLRRGGARSEVAPAACQARTLHLDRERQRLFYACASAASTQQMDSGEAGSAPRCARRCCAGRAVRPPPWGTR
ncbi:MAG: hypothetical protein U0168_10800 [Nannocystaceae bacterium]